MRAALCLFLLMVPVLVAPSAASQAVAAESCVRRCDPLEENPPDWRTRSAWVFFYPTTVVNGDLTVVAPQRPRQDVELSPLGPVTIERCYLARWILGNEVRVSDVDARYEGLAWRPAGPLKVQAAAELFLYVRLEASYPGTLPVRFLTSVTSGTQPGGTLLAEGETVENLAPGPLWEVAVPLQNVADGPWPSDPPQDQGFTVDTRICVGGLAEAGAPVNLVLANGRDIPARLLLEIEELILADDLMTSFGRDQVEIAFTVLPILGAYDLDVSRARLSVVSPANVTWSATIRPLPDYRDHFEPGAPTEFVWRVPREQVDLSVNHTVRAHLENLQGTFYVEAEDQIWTAEFDGSSRTPSLGLLPVLLVLAATGRAVSRLRR